MAEVLVQTRAHAPDPSPQDGDPIVVVGRPQVRDQAFRTICDVNGCPADHRLANGIIRADSPCYRYQLETMRTRIEVLSSDERRIVDQATGQSARESGPRIAALIRQTVARRLRQRTLFGTRAHPVWFAGGYREPDAAAVLRIWNTIETQTPERRTAWTRWRWGSEERRVHLVLPIEEVTQVRMRALQEPETEVIGTDDDGQPIVEVRRYRQHRVPWQELGLPQTPEQVRDPNVESDLRDAIAELTDTAAFRRKAARGRIG